MNLEGYRHVNEADAVEREPSLAWSLSREQVGEIALQNAWKEPVSRDWAGRLPRRGGSHLHRRLGDRSRPSCGGWDRRRVGRALGDDDEVVETHTGRPLRTRHRLRRDNPVPAPDCELYSVRVLGENASGTGAMLLTGLRWAVRQGFGLINLSLSTTRSKFADELRALADEAYFRGPLVCVGAQHAGGELPLAVRLGHLRGQPRGDGSRAAALQPKPPVEFFAPGQNVEVAWPGGGTIRMTGNSFATPLVAAAVPR